MCFNTATRGIPQHRLMGVFGLTRQQAANAKPSRLEFVEPRVWRAATCGNSSNAKESTTVKTSRQQQRPVLRFSHNRRFGLRTFKSENGSRSNQQQFSDGGTRWIDGFCR